MITFQRETVSKELYEDMLPLMRASAEEVYSKKGNTVLYNSMELDNIISSKVDYNFYLQKEQQGLLNICTMRDGKKLAGHWSCLLNYHAQSKDLLIAETQNIHVLKEYRGENSKNFMKFTEEMLKKRGVKLLYMAINPALNQQSLMEYMGFTLDEIVYSKGL